MNAFAPLLAALAVSQAAPPDAAQPAAAAERSGPATEPAAASTTARPARAPRPAAAPSAAAPSPAVVSTTAPPRPSPTTAPSPRPSPPARAGGEGGTRPTATKPPTATPTATRTPLPEREDAERAARAFLEALVARDADALAAAAAQRFSFDGDAQEGREAVRRTWRTILASREEARPRIGPVEILAAADAIARFGKPPARIAPLARPGVLVAVADVGGRAVVLFLAREGGRMAVLGMHD
jgi:hypothetical protein